MAILTVMIAIGLCSVLGLAMLSNGSIQSQIAGNGARAAQARYLAESGLTYAMRVIERDAMAGDASFANRSFPIGSDGGAFAVTVTRDGTDATLYEAVSIGTVPDGNGQTAEATARARFTAESRLDFAYGASFGAATNFSTASLGNLSIDSAQAAGSLQLRSNNVVTTAARASNLASPVVAAGYPPASGQTYSPAWDVHLPKASTINTYGSYLHGGLLRTASELPLVLTNELSPLTVLLPGILNPGAVWRYTSGTTLVMRDGVSINGTLIVHGNLEVRGSGNTINATAANSQGLPALIVLGELRLASNANLTVDGVTFVRTRLRMATGSTGTFRGAYISEQGLYTPASGSTVVIQHDPDKNVEVPSLDTNVPAKVSVLSWQVGQ